jgi:F0F1-type ATP synthase membrane subunit b/b'
MNPTTFLQIFLLVNVFLIGAIFATALRHAYAHFRPHPHEIEKPHQPKAPSVQLPAEVRDHLLQTAQANFQSVLDHSNAELEHDLKTTVAQLNSRLEKMGVDIVNDEMRRYRMDLDQLRKQTEANISGAQTEIVQHQTDLKSKIDQRRAELEAKLEEEIAAEKQLLIQQLDTKLADAVASFLSETLGHNIDLGAQSAYLTSMLEEHKNDLIKGISDET